MLTAPHTVETLQTLRVGSACKRLLHIPGAASVAPAAPDGPRGSEIVAIEKNQMGLPPRSRVDCTSLF